MDTQMGAQAAVIWPVGARGRSDVWRHTPQRVERGWKRPSRRQIREYEKIISEDGERRMPPANPGQGPKNLQREVNLQGPVGGMKAMVPLVVCLLLNLLSRIAS